MESFATEICTVNILSNRYKTKMAGEVWPSWRSQTASIRTHPKFKLALQSYNSIQYLEINLRKGCRVRDATASQIILHVLALFQCARNALRELQILDRREFDFFSMLHIQYISKLLSDC